MDVRKRGNGMRGAAGLLLALIGCLAAAGCAGSGRSAIALPVEASGAEVVWVEGWPRTEAVEGGFGPLEPERGWARGDSVLFSLDLSTGRERRHRLIEIVLLDRSTAWWNWEMTSGDDGAEQAVSTPLVWCLVNSYEWDGTDPQTARPLGTRLSHFPEISLRAGLFEYSTLVERTGGRTLDKWSIDQTDQATGWLFAAMGLGRVFRGDTDEGAAFLEIIRRPSFLSILLNLGVRMSITQKEEGAKAEGWRAEPVKVSLAGRGGGRQRVVGRRVPLVLEINGKPALRASVVATRVVPPLGPSNGIVLVEAAHPADPDKWATLRLVGARTQPTEWELPDELRDALIAPDE